MCDCKEGRFDCEGRVRRFLRAEGGSSEGQAALEELLEKWVDTNTNGGTTPFSTATADAQIVVSSVNGAPVLDPDLLWDFNPIDEEDAANDGDTVQWIIDHAISDVDVGAIQGIAAQVDFGKGAPVVSAEGRRRRTHLFRMVLSHSRKGYSEVSYRQTTEEFIRCLENAFWYFGGCPSLSKRTWKKLAASAYRSSIGDAARFCWRSGEQ